MDKLIRVVVSSTNISDHLNKITCVSLPHNAFFEAMFEFNEVDQHSIHYLIGKHSIGMVMYNF